MGRQVARDCISCSSRRIADRDGTEGANHSLPDKLDIWVEDRAVVPAAKVLNRSEPKNPVVVNYCKASLVYLAIVRERPKDSLPRACSEFWLHDPRDSIDRERNEKKPPNQYRDPLRDPHHWPLRNRLAIAYAA